MFDSRNPGEIARCGGTYLGEAEPGESLEFWAASLAELVSTRSEGNLVSKNTSKVEDLGRHSKLTAELHR